MGRIPEPEQTSQGPVYEGRLLDRADEEVVDQGAAFDLQTLVTRRRVLSLLGLSAGALALAACAPTTTGTGEATSTSEIPDETAGPYPGDGSNGPDILEQSGIIRSDIRSSLDGGTTATGVPMTLTLTVLDMADNDALFTDAAVYVWHCDSAGGYSMYSTGIESETYLRGVQVADAAGAVTFTSVFPACYTGRWPHIHFEVYPDAASITDSTKAIATSQVALPEDVSRTVYGSSGYDGSTANLEQVSLSNDNVFSDDGGATQLATVTGNVTAGYTVALTVRVDTGTTPSAGTAPGGGGGQGGPPPGGAPGGTPPGESAPIGS